MVWSPAARGSMIASAAEPPRTNRYFRRGEIMSARRLLIDGLAAAAALFLATEAAPAQNYPSQPIRIVVPTAPGGVADIAGRRLAQRLNEIGKIAVVENRTGGGGAIAAEFVAKSAPD